MNKTRWIWLSGLGAVLLCLFGYWLVGWMNANDEEARELSKFFPATAFETGSPSSPAGQANAPATSSTPDR